MNIPLTNLPTLIKYQTTNNLINKTPQPDQFIAPIYKIIFAFF